MNWVVGLSIVTWLGLWLLVLFSWGLKEIDEAQAPTNAQFDLDDALAATDYNANRDAVQAARPT
jgi:hypothetical protein